MGRVGPPVLAAAALLGATCAFAAPSLQDALSRAEAEERLAAEAAYTNSVCGGALAIEVDWPSFETLAQRQNSAVTAPDIVAKCDEALGALELLCARGEAARAAVAGEVAVLVCRGAAMRGIALDEGVLSYAAPPGTARNHDFILQFLEAALGL